MGGGEDGKLEEQLRVMGEQGEGCLSLSLSIAGCVTKQEIKSMPMAIHCFYSWL